MEAHKHLIDWGIMNHYVVQVEVEDSVEYTGQDYDEAVEASEAGDIGCITLGRYKHEKDEQGKDVISFHHLATFAFVHEYAQEDREHIYDWSGSPISRAWDAEYTAMMGEE